ncbi:hypothetical protein PILCRDRAFT_253848 [Piloderma croceum F 1598]|uniref:DUF6533 domain-containing protein n=1 Tax=Piloderma croceum (strain F 1598) TaxID=765440 RepID=A0A0C3FV73_PILCF|nr:hypothetical protein PILCRDRAFT_253848 [Piloderma croceum F 1598]
MSTVGYLPLDSDAPSYFKSARTANYVCVAFTMLLLYDHCITLDKEVEWIWTLRWRLPKILFLTNRYLLTLLIVLTNFSGTIYPLSLSPIQFQFCKFFNNFLTWSPIFNFYVAELLMIIRVCSLYGHRKVTTAPNKSVPKHINELVLLAIKACPLAFGRLFRS